MPITQLLLGPILFQDFELPASIGWGGAQSLTVHRLPGGTRVIDAMGRDDAEITWSGIFSGQNASARARALDLMRADGGLWPLTWESHFYSVVISSFEAEHRRPNWIPYRLSCTVLQDETAALLQSAAASVLDLAAGLAQDLAMAATLMPTPPPPNLDQRLLASTDLGKATTATDRDKLITVAARVAIYSRGVTLHSTEYWTGKLAGLRWLRPPSQRKTRNRQTTQPHRNHQLKSTGTQAQLSNSAKLESQIKSLPPHPIAADQRIKV